MSILEKAARGLEDKVLIDMLGGRVANYLKPHVNDLLETLSTADSDNSIKTIISHDPENFITQPGIIKINLSTNPITRGRHKVTLDVLETPSSDERNYDLTHISLIRKPDGDLLVKSVKPYEHREINHIKLLSNVNLELNGLQGRNL